MLVVVRLLIVVVRVSVVLLAPRDVIMLVAVLVCVWMAVGLRAVRVGMIVIVIMRVAVLFGHIEPFS